MMGSAHFIMALLGRTGDTAVEHDLSYLGLQHPHLVLQRYS